METDQVSGNNQERKFSSMRQLPSKLPDAVTGKLGQFGEWASNRDWQHYGQWMQAAPGELGQRVLVMNPMHIVHLSGKTKSRLVKIVEFFRGFTEKWFSHLLLLMVLIGYAIIGAWIFLVIEGAYEQQLKGPVLDIREKLKTEVWRFTTTEKMSRSRLDELIDIRLKDLEKQLFDNFTNRSTGDSFKTSWTFWSAIVYCFTVFTTIGYGHIVPITKIGRIVTIFYACIGIPLLLMVLADLGKLFTRSIKYVFKIVKKVFYAKKLKKMRQAGRRATMAQQNLAQTIKSHGLKLMTKKGETKAEDDSNKEGEVKVAEEETSFHEVPGVTITSPTTPFVYTTSATGPGGEPLVILSPRIGAPGPNFAGTTSVGPALLEDGSVPPLPDDLEEFNLPVSLALTILFGYMFAGAWIFTYTDNWSYVDAIYFVFISTTTVGFGDLTPESEWSMICLSVYLLFGLALTSMCINVIQEQLAVAFEEAKFRLGTRMGMDVSISDEDVGGPSAGGSRRGSKSKKNLHEDNNNKKSQSNLSTKAEAGSLKSSTFEIRQDAIGKSLKDKRDQKRSTSATRQELDERQPPPLPKHGGLYGSPLMREALSQASSAPNIAKTSPSTSSSTLAPQAPTRRSREGRSPNRRNVNFGNS